MDEWLNKEHDMFDITKNSSRKKRIRLHIIKVGMKWMLQSPVLSDEMTYTQVKRVPERKKNIVELDFELE